MRLGLTGRQLRKYRLNLGYSRNIQNSPIFSRRVTQTGYTFRNRVRKIAPLSGLDSMIAYPPGRYYLPIHVNGSCRPLGRVI